MLPTHSALLIPFSVAAYSNRRCCCVCLARQFYSPAIPVIGYCAGKHVGHILLGSSCHGATGAGPQVLAGARLRSRLTLATTEEEGEAGEGRVDPHHLWGDTGRTSDWGKEPPNGFMLLWGMLPLQMPPRNRECALLTRLVSFRGGHPPKTVSCSPRPGGLELCTTFPCPGGLVLYFCFPSQED